MGDKAPSRAWFRRYVFNYRKYVGEFPRWSWTMWLVANSWKLQSGLPRALSAERRNSARAGLVARI
jgi:hypothetical protein